MLPVIYTDETSVSNRGKQSCEITGHYVFMVTFSMKYENTEVLGGFVQ